MSASRATAASKVEEVMTTHPVCVTGAADIRELAQLFDGNEISGVPVVDNQNRVIGVVSKSDLIRRCLEGPPGARTGADFFDILDSASMARGVMNPEDLGTVDDFMSTDPVCVAPDESLKDVARKMAEERVHRVIVVDEDRHPLGVATTLDLMKVFGA